MPPAATGLSSNMLWVIISVIGGVTVIAVIIIIAIFTHRYCAKAKQRAAQHKNVSYMPANKGKPATVELKPPDLWINYDHAAAQRSMDRSEDMDEGTAMMSQTSYDDRDPGECENVNLYRHMLHCPKPNVMIPVDHPQLPRDPSDHMVYPRGSHQLGSPGQPPPSYANVPRVNAAQILSNPLPSQTDAPRRDFTRPGLVGSSSGGLKLPPDITIKTRLPSGPRSDTDRDSSLSSPSKKVPSPITDVTPVTTLSPTFSTEELSAEMANLEGLMKDLNNITQQQQEFDC